MSFETKTTADGGRSATIQWFRTGEFVKVNEAGERIEKIKGVDEHRYDWRGYGKVKNEQIVQVISQAMVGPNGETL